MFFRMFVADYFDGTYAVNTFLEGMSSIGFMPSLFTLIKQCIINVYTTFMSGYEPWLEFSKWYIIVIGIISLVFWVVNRKEKYGFIPFVFMFLSIFGVILLYLPGGVALRAIYSSGVFAMVFMMIKTKPLSFKNGLKIACLSAAGVFLIGSFAIQSMFGFDPRVWYEKSDYATYENIANELQKIVILKDAKTPWENTVAISVELTYDANHPQMRIPEMLLPAGAGINYYMDLSDESKPLDAKYVMIKTDSDEKNALINKGYRTLIDEICGVTVMVKE